MKTAIPGTPTTGLDSPRRSALIRGAAFFALWLVLMQSLKPADLAIGVVAASLATWVSLRLLAPSAGRLRLGSLLMLVPHFLWQSGRAGLDVAGRALAPRVRLHPGFVPSPAARKMACLFTTVWTPHNRWSLSYRMKKAVWPASRWQDKAMTEFLLISALFVLAMVALGLLRVLRGTSDADSLMAAH